MEKREAGPSRVVHHYGVVEKGVVGIWERHNNGEDIFRRSIQVEGFNEKIRKKRAESEAGEACEASRIR